MSEPADDVLDEELGEILEAPPPAWARYSATIVLGTLGVAVLVAASIRYPDTQRVRATIVSSEPPLPVVARRSGRVVELRVREGAQVRAGEILAVLDHDGATDDLLALEPILTDLRRRLSSLERLVESEPLRVLSLGELGPFYASLGTSLEELRVMARDDEQRDRTTVSRALVADGAALVQQLKREREIAREGVLVAQDKQRRTGLLVAEGLATGADVEDAKANLVRARTELEDLASRVVAARATAGDASLRLATLKHETWRRHRELLRSVAEAHQRLESGLREWQRTVLLRSPIEGRVTLRDVWSPGQFVRESQDVFEVLPDAAIPIARAVAPQQNIGRFSRGQPVRIVLDAYPIERFGIIHGRVAEIAPSTGRATGEANTDARYLVRIELPEGLRTTHGVGLELRQGMTGDADILLEDLSLLARLFYPLRGLWVRANDR